MGATEWLIILAVAALLFRARQVGRAAGGIAGEFLAGARGADARRAGGGADGEPGGEADHRLDGATHASDGAGSKGGSRAAAGRPASAGDAAAAERSRLLAVLELPADATSEQIQRAWRELVKVWHPDRFAHDPALQARATARLAAINAAHARLMPTRT